MPFRFFLSVASFLLCVIPFSLSTAAPHTPPENGTPILLYHRFGPTVADGMTVKTSVFESHLRFLRDNGYEVIPLRRLVAWRLKQGPPPPPKAVVIVEDDGHRSVFTDMLPLVKKYNVPVTVFIYPSAVSNARYAMTWEQLRELKKTGLFEFQSHTFWHPNFKKERRNMSPQDFERSVCMQLNKSKAKIEKELGVKVDMLAWPFGIYDDHLMNKAAQAGYIAAFSIERGHVTADENNMHLPRSLMTNSDQGKVFARIVAGTAPKRNIVY